MSVTLKTLQNKIDTINEMTGNPLEPYTKTENGYVANIGSYHISQAYGGVALVRMVSEGGGESMPTHSGHITKKELNHQLDGFLAALRAMKAQA
jgi:hypothetical protein